MKEALRFISQQRRFTDEGETSSGGSRLHWLGRRGEDGSRPSPVGHAVAASFLW